IAAEPAEPAETTGPSSDGDSAATASLGGPTVEMVATPVTVMATIWRHETPSQGALTGSSNMNPLAVAVGFEPTEGRTLACFQDMFLRPLGHATSLARVADGRCHGRSRCRMVAWAITSVAARRMMSFSTYWPSNVGVWSGPPNSSAGMRISGERIPT